MDTEPGTIPAELEALDFHPACDAGKQGNHPIHQQPPPCDDPAVMVGIWGFPCGCGPTVFYCEAHYKWVRTWVDSVKARGGFGTCVLHGGRIPAHRWVIFHGL